ncbi:MAG: MBL fold metallo-hydrolase [Deltaproteobacteria bacterium]|nr:MAG: MBL fold metallo-hydrolase [Deltaproteobacteria bacterium]
MADFIVTILGSGTCVPSLKRSSCSVLIEIDGSKLLFDSGAGTMRRLLETGATVFEISHIFYSHFHPDHTSELIQFLFANKYPDSSRRKKPLTIIAGNGFTNFFSGLQAAYGNWIELAPGMLKMIELYTNSEDSQDFEKFTVNSLPVEHNDESLAYRITSPNGKSVVYSGDTDYSDNLVYLAEDTDLLICESALPDQLKVDGHLTPSLAGEIATRANVKKLILTHFYPECDQADIKKECRKTYSGPLLLAEDLLKIELDG